MAGPSASELRVLISILQEGTGVKSLLADTKDLAKALKSVDQQTLSNLSQQVQTIHRALPPVSKAVTNVGGQLGLPFAGGGVGLGVSTSAVTGLGVASKTAAANVASLLAKTQPLTPALNDAAAAADKAAAAKKKDAESSEKLDSAYGQLTRGLRFLMGGFLALEGVRFFKDILDTAARTQVLGTVLHVVGKNAGIARDELDKTDKKIQSMGITASASRQAMVQFIQAGFELEHAAPLARAAQDAAVVLGTDSSEAFSRLVTATQQMNTLMLRSMGIIILRDQAEQKYAQNIGRTAGQLTLRQKQEAFLLATIEKAAALQGTYTAAMGDVGKQLTSLARLQEELKVSIGNGLLPTYLALVEELSLLMKQLRLVSEVEGLQSSRAQELGNTMKGVFAVIREGVLFLAEHVRLVVAGLGAWAAWKFAIAPVARLLALFAAEGSGVVVTFSGFIAGLTLIPALVIALGAALVYLTAKFQPVNAVVGTLIGAIITFGTLLKGLLGIMTGALNAAAQTIVSFIMNPFDLEGMKKPWKAWGDYIKDTMSEVGDWWDLTRARFKQIFTGDPGDTTGGASKALNEQIQVAKKQADDALIALDAATKKATLMQTSPDPRETKKANDNLTKVKEASARAEKTLDDLLHNENISDARRKQEEDERAANEKRRKEDRRIQDRQDANEQTTAGKFTFLGGKEQSAGFSTMLGGLNTKIELYNDMMREGTTSKEELLNMRHDLDRTIQLAGAAAQVPGDVGDLKKTVETFAKSPGISKAQRDEAAKSIRVAALNAIDKRIAETSGIDAQSKALFLARLEPLNKQLALEAAALKARNQQAAALDQERYNLGLMTQDEYFEKSEARIRSASAREIAIARNAVANIEKEQAQGFAKKAEDKAALQTRLLEAQNALKELTGTAATATTAATPSKEDIDIETNLIAWRAARKELSESLIQLRLDGNAFWGGEEAAIAQVINKYRLLLEQKGPGAAEALEEAKGIEILQTQLDFKNRRLEAELEYQRSILAVEQARVTIDVNEGRITTTEAMRRQNELVAREKENLLYKIDKQEEILLAQQVAREIQAQKVRAELAKQGLEGADLETELNREMFGIDKLIADTETGIRDLTVQVESMASKIQRYGTELRKVFTDSLSTAISDSLKNVRNAGNAFMKLGENLKNNVIDTVAKDMSEKVTRSILNATSQRRQKVGGKEGEMENVPGTSVFDKVFSMMGLGTDKNAGKPDGSSKAKAIHVQGIVSIDNVEMRTVGGEAIGGPTGPENFGPAALASAFKPGGEAYQSLFRTNQVLGNLASSAGQFVKPFQALFSGNLASRSTASVLGGLMPGGGGFAEGGPVVGPGTGMSDSVLARVSAGEHIMPAAKAKLFMPLLEGIRLGKYALGGIVNLFKIGPLQMPSFAYGGVVGDVHSIAMMPVIPRYAAGGMVVSDGGSVAVQPGSAGLGHMMVQLHPDAMNMSMREWLEHEVVRQQGRR